MSNFTIKSKNLPKNTKEFEILASWDMVSAKRDEAFAELASAVSVPGFRKGQAPKDMAGRLIDPEKLYDKAGRKILPELYKELIEKEKIKPVTTPSVELLEAKENEPWKFKVTVAEIPEVKVKDYKKRVKEAHEKAAADKKSDSDKNAATKKSDEKEPQKEQDATKTDDIANFQAPPDDKPAKASLSEIFRILLEESEVEIPDLLTQEEVSRRLSSLEQDIKKVGLTFDQYLASRNMKADELKAQLQKEADDMYRLEFVLAEIAKKEDIKVESTEIDAIFAGAKTDKEREVAAQNADWYEGILRKQKVLDFLNDL